jgi:hypothetical protein
MLYARYLTSRPSERATSRASARPSLGVSGGLGRFGHRFHSGTVENSPLELGRKVLLPCSDRAVPIVQPPALPAGLRASLQLNDIRPPLQTTVYKHLVQL